MSALCTIQGIQRRAASVRDRVGNVASNVASFAKDQAQGLGEKATDARHRAADLYQDTPLAAGALALAIGALIGSATPLSQTEREGLSGVANKASGVGADLAERGARAVQDQIDGAVH